MGVNATQTDTNWETDRDMILRVQLQETGTLDLYYQENTSVHEEDELAAVLLTQWKDYEQVIDRWQVIDR